MRSLAADEGEVGCGRAVEERGEVDPVVCRVELLTEDNDRPLLPLVALDDGLGELVPDHPMADDDEQAFVRGHSATASSGATPTESFRSRPTTDAGPGRTR